MLWFNSSPCPGPILQTTDVPQPLLHELWMSLDVSGSTLLHSFFKNFLVLSTIKHSNFLLSVLILDF